MENVILKRERMGAKHCNFKAPERLVVRPRLESNAIPHIQTMHCLTNQHDITAGKENTKSSCKALESGEKVNTEMKYFGYLPSIDAHSGHPLGCDACDTEDHWVGF